MQIHELLQFVDDAVYLNTGEHLNDIQRAVIEGSLISCPGNDLRLSASLQPPMKTRQTTN